MACVFGIDVDVPLKRVLGMDEIKGESRERSAGRPIAAIASVLAGLLLLSCGQGDLRVSPNPAQTGPEAAEAQQAARDSFLYSVKVQHQVDQGLGCVKSTVGAFNTTEESYRLSRLEAATPIETVPAATIAWICDFAGEFGLPGKPTSYARVVLKEGAAGIDQGAAALLSRILLYVFYAESPPPIVSAK